MRKESNNEELMKISPIGIVNYRRNDNNQQVNMRQYFSSPAMDSVSFKCQDPILEGLAKRIRVEQGGHLEEFLSKEKIQARVQALAKQINEDYAGKNVYVICVLNGAKRFSDDLTKAMGKIKEDGKIKLESYSGMASSGRVSVKEQNFAGIENYDHILVIEDIVDTGNTMDFLLAKLAKDYKGKTVKLCTLLDKPSRRQKLVHIDYTGFEIEDKFVIGYGMDYDGMGRELDAIYQVIKD